MMSVCSYLAYIRSTVESNLQQAEQGGIPGTYNLVRAFLNIKMPTIAPVLEVRTLSLFSWEISRQSLPTLLLLCCMLS